MNLKPAVAACVLVLLTVRLAAAQSPAATGNPPAGGAQERSTGLPSHVKWTFNFDAGWGTFGFGNSLYNNPKGSEPENLSDQWFEGFIKPALSASHTFAGGSEVYGKISAAGERTYGSSPELYGPDVSSFGPEDLMIGWRSDKPDGASKPLVDLAFGRVPYQLGHGMLLWDGASEGGSRGGYWTNTRKAFELAAIGRIAPGPHRIDVFYLDKDELDESETGTRLWGANYELGADDTTVGVSYLRFFADPDVRPDRDGLNVFNVRAYGAPLRRVPDLSVEFEYAAERNGDLVHSNAWNLKGGYELSSIAWKPTLSYRYAFFQGDDPHTLRNEAFDPLLTGFSDWGSWWQGEIAGEYFLSNSNLISHQVRAHVTPGEKVGGGLIFYDFRLDKPQSIGTAVTDKHVAFETDLYTDWKVTSTLTLSILTAFADPGAAVRQSSGRTKNFTYLMIYAAYGF